MSGRAIDHAVIHVGDLEKAAESFEAFGFRLTPTAFHEDRMGTCNRLVQFSEKNFLEIVQVDRPHLLERNHSECDPPFFNFGDHLRRSEVDTMPMMVFATDDARADIEGFRNAQLNGSNVETYAPFDFERTATLPNGNAATVAFSLAFTTSPDMPRLAFFTCQNRLPQAFWRAEFQKHPNGASGISTVYLASDDPHRDARTIASLFATSGRDQRSVLEEEGIFVSVACGPQQKICVTNPTAMESFETSYSASNYRSPSFVGLELNSQSGDSPMPPFEGSGTETPSIHGVFLRWSRR